MRALAILLLVALAAPLGAQVIPDEFPRPGDPLADRTVRDLEERHLGFLTRFYSVSDASASPAYNDFGAAVATNVEIGYQLLNGDAIALFGTLETELARAVIDPVFDVPLGSAVGARYVLGLERFADGGLYENAEVALGATQFTGFVSGTALDLAPRYVFPSGKPWRYVVGVQARHLVQASDERQRRWFVGPTFGVRFQYVPKSRIVLESSEVD